MPVAGIPTTVPIFVDPTSGTETARGAYRLTYCRPSLGIFELSTGLTAPTAAGTYTWHAFVTPPGVNGSPPDPNGVYELRSVVALPHTLKSKATYSTRTHLLTITGKATAAGGPEAGASVEIAQQKGTTAVHFGATRTRADGTFTLRKRVVQTAAARMLTFDAGSTTIPGDCTDPPLAPAGCLLQTYASASDATFRARIPAKPKAKPRKH